MKKINIISIGCSIAIIGSSLFSLYTSATNKQSHWDDFTKVFQELSLPDQEKVIDAEIFDVLGKPFKIKIEYISSDPIDRDLISYRKVLEKHDLKEDPTDPMHLHTADGLLHFYLTETKNRTHKIVLSNGVW